jgi:hypothetical protein
MLHAFGVYTLLAVKAKPKKSEITFFKSGKVVHG